MQSTNQPTGPQTPGPDNPDDLYGGTYLSARDWTAGDTTGAIIGTSTVKFPGRDGADAVRKVVIDVENMPALIVVNKTSYRLLVAKFGNNLTEWLGKSVLIRKLPTNKGDMFHVSPANSQAGK